MRLQAVLDVFRRQPRIVALEIQLPQTMPAAGHWTLRVGSAPDLEEVATGEGLRRLPGESLQVWRMRITDRRGSAGVLARLEGAGDRWPASAGVRAPLPGTLRRLIGSVEGTPRALFESFIELDGPLTGSETIEIQMLPGEGL